jgi:DNA-binding response OmpR family regulator
LRRSTRKETLSPPEAETMSSLKIVKIGALYEFCFEKLQLSSPTQTRELTYREAEVLRYLVEHAQQVIKREDLLKAIWGDDDYFMGRSLDVFISRLRKYLADDPHLKLEGIHGVGFRMRW